KPQHDYGLEAGDRRLEPEARSLSAQLIATVMPLRAPRHLRTSTINPLSFACSRKRTAAGDGSSAAAGVLYKNPILRPDSAASCKRRTSRSFTNGHHANAAPNALQRSVCSNAHNVSTEALVSITSKRCNCTPLCASAGAKGTYGGEM